jgi:hypothetical protein
MSREQNAGQNLNVKIGYQYFETVAEFKHLRTTLANQNTFMKKLRAV